MTNTKDITLEERIEAARVEVAQLCETKGADSPDCAVAQDSLEELLAAKSHQKPAKNSLQQFCEDNPDAAECRLYED
jgi:CP12 domain